MKRVAIVVGHTQKEQGAKNRAFDMSEFRYNDGLAQLLADELKQLHIDPIVVYRETLSDLPHKVNLTHADICISLHCNAFNGSISGSEVLYYSGSRQGGKLAGLLQKSIHGVLDSRDRGTKEITYNERGGLLLKNTVMPCVICEPFFIDSDADYLNAMGKEPLLAEAMAKAVSEFF